MVPFQPPIHKLKPQYTTDPLFHHIIDLEVSQVQRSHMYHNKFFFFLRHKMLPNRNQQVCKLPIYKKFIYMVHDDILWFDISVSNSSVLKIFDGFSQIFYFLGSVTFLKLLFITAFQIIKKTSLLQIFHDQVNIFNIVKNTKNSEYKRMIEITL